MITIEDLRDGDDEAAYRLGQQAFGGTEPFDPERPRMEPERVVAAYAGDVLVGQVRRHEFGQYFGGRRIPCAGISGVAVAPEARNRRLARRMLAESMERAAAAGEVIASLYPTTAALYRSVGFEVAGWWAQRRVPISELPREDGDLVWERVEVGDERLPEMYERMAPDHDGWIEPPAAFWTWRAMAARADTKTNRFAYVGLRDGGAAAGVQYSYGPSERAMYRMEAESVVGIDGQAIRSALAFLGANGTTADELRTVLPSDELELHLSHVQRTSVERSWPWMLAFVDLPGAIAARGYPFGVSGVVPLDVHDANRPSNAGRWLLDVRDGSARLEPGGDGRVAVRASDLAAVFTGHLDPLRLARAGRLGAPTVEDVSLLRAAFAGHPSLTIFF